jgi:hypothetical protein
MMPRQMPLVMLIITALLLSTAMAIAPSRASAQAPEPVKIRVRITDNGWDGKGSTFAVTVEEGQLIELTFAFDQQIHLGDEHIFILDGYNLEWDKIDATHREATKRFLADKPGTFRLKCDVECEIHDQLKNGTLTVARKGTVGSPSAGGGTAGPDTRPESKLTVSAPVGATTGETAPLMVNAVDPVGKPIAGARAHLMETVSFLGSLEQDVEVAVGTTNKDGQATLAYTARRTGARALKVVFDGNVDHKPSSLALQLAVTDAGQTYHVEPPPGIPGVNRFLVSGVIITVWGTMFIVAWHVLAIVRAGRGDPETEGRNG